MGRETRKEAGHKGGGVCPSALQMVPSELSPLGPEAGAFSNSSDTPVGEGRSQGVDRLHI